MRRIKKFRSFPLVAVVAIWLAHPFVSLSQSVDPLTGRAQVSIPLWTISNGDISIPISAWHHGGALRVDEVEGSCGLGWNLSAGGAISRQVRGLPDDYNVANDSRKGWLFNSNASAIQGFSLSVDDNLSDCNDESDEFSFIFGLGRVSDPEPDIFYFNAPGLSGSFVFGSDGNPKLLSYQDLSFTVTKDANNVITYFTIKNNLGIVYTFGVREDVTRKVYKNTPIYVSYFKTEYKFYQDQLTYTSTWHLTSISSTATGSSASFNYDDATESEGNRYVITIGSDNVADTLYYVRDAVTPKELTSISVGAYTATITWLNGLARKVSITETLGNSRDFEFIYRGFINSTNNSGPVYRYFLKEIKQLHSCQPVPSYSFAYQSVAFATDGIGTVEFPWNTRLKQDYWGYYNAGSTNKNIPSAYFYSGESNGKRLRIQPISGTSATTTLTGDNREVNSSVCGFGALTQINYPHGGQTKFTYEPNKYYDPTVSRSYTGGGVRVASISTSGGDVAYGKGSTSFSSAHDIQKDYEYKLSNDTTSGVLTYPPKFAFVTDSGVFRTPYQLGQDPQILYSRVKEKLTGRGSTVYEFDATGTFNYGGGPSSKIARSGYCAVGNFKNGDYTFPYAPQPNFEWGVLKKQSEYSQAGSLVRQKRLTYTTLMPAAQTIYGLRFENISNGFHFSKYSISTGTVKVLSEEISVEIGEESAADSIKTTTAYSYNSGHYMLETITRTNDDGSVAVDRIKYAKDYATISSPSGGDVPANALKQLNNAETDRRHGEIVERIQKFTPIGGTQKVTGASLVLYKIFPNSRLAPYQYLSYPQVSSYFYESAVSDQTIKYDSSYVVTRTVDDVSAEGIVLAESDNKKNVSGYHVIPSYSVGPTAVFAQCKGSEAVYEGFELSTGRGFTGGTTEVAGWTGDQGKLLSGTTGSFSSVSVTKNGNKYRVSCWANAGQQTAITFKAKNGGTDVSGSTTNLDYNPSTMNKWVYLEGLMDVTSATTPFTVYVSSNHDVNIDDLLALPQNAAVSMNTYKPLVGVTSQTDIRGNSVVFTYDSLGRKLNTFDRKRNLVENKQYLYRGARTRAITSGFTSSTLTHRKSQSSTFTAVNTGCVTGTTYSWAIYGTSSTALATSTNSTIIYSFTGMGAHSVKLTVSHATYGSVTFTENICVGEPLPTTMEFYMSGGGTTVHRCNDLVRTFYILHPQSSDSTKAITYGWYIMTAAVPYWTPIPGAPNAGSFNFTSPLENYSIKCTMTIVYLNIPPVSESLCPTSCQPPPQETAAIAITYVDNSPCP